MTERVCATCKYFKKTIEEEPCIRCALITDHELWKQAKIKVKKSEMLAVIKAAVELYEQPMLAHIFNEKTNDLIQTMKDIISRAEAE